VSESRDGMDTFARFARLRLDLLAAVDRALARDPYCKSYEGAINLRLPSRLDEGTEGAVEMELHLYVIGPARHYAWAGRTLAEVLDQCEPEIRGWIAEHEGGQG